MQGSIKKGKQINAVIYLLCGLFAFLAFFHSAAYAKQGNIRVRSISLEHGLSQTTITSMAQDHHGFMWFGTQDGLNRYDGYQFKVYRPEPNNSKSISSNSIWSLLVDHQNVLWVGTYLGLNRYDSKTDSFTSYQFDPENSQSISHNDVNALYEDSQGRIWVGTRGGGLNYFDREHGIFDRYMYNPKNAGSISNATVNTIHEDSEGNLWVGTNKGLNRFNVKNKSFELGSLGNEKLKSSVILTLEEDNKGNLWIGTETEGVFAYNKKDNTLKHFQHDPTNINSISGNKVWVVFQDSKDQLWFGTYGEGLNKFNYHNETFTYYKHSENEELSLSGDRIYSLFEDRSGVLWIGSYNTGLNKLDPYNFNLTLKRNRSLYDVGKNEGDVRAFLVDQYGVFWTGSELAGLLVTDTDGSIRQYRHDPEDPYSLSANEVFSIYEDSKANVWVGTGDGGIHKFDRKNKRFIRYSTQLEDNAGLRHGRVRAMREDSKGNFWVGVDGGGLHLFDRDKETFQHFHYNPNDSGSLSNNRVFSIFEDQYNDVWIATFGGGLNIYINESQTFKKIKHNPEDNNSLSYDYVLLVTQDSKGIYWIGTDGQGLNRYDKQANKFTRYDEQHGLPNNTIYAILEDDSGYLWMTHNKGMSRFDPENLVFKNYDVSDGLQNNEFNGNSYYKDAQGKFYFGGIDGYNAFFPHEIIENPHPPRVVITDFQLFNKHVPVGADEQGRMLLERVITETNHLTLSYKDSVFSFQFAALDYVLPSRNQYAYMMEGIETDWNYAGNRRYVTYTTLPPGKYKFRVKASNNHGVWNQEGTALTISVLPPLWQTWWFRLLIALALVIGIFLFYTWRIKSIQARNKLLKEEVRVRTRQLQRNSDELEKQKLNLEETLLELGETKDALIETAHKAGMADTATGVLHNVGNLLNSVTTSIGVIRGIVNNPVNNRFFKANELLKSNLNNIEEFITNNPKGKKLLNYYIELEAPFKEETLNLVDNANCLTDNIIAIKEAIAAQQRYAKGRGFIEQLCLADIVEDALTLQAGSIGRHEINVKKEFDNTVPPINVQKAKLVQILLNLYKNAKESMDANANEKNTLSIKIGQDEENAYVSIADTGVGIEEALLQDIFAYGFTTKKLGNGFGLHSCANYMTEMGGKMWAESNGAGKGATFVLLFPINGTGMSSCDDNPDLIPIKKAS